jgi:hypothetical protein
LQQKEQDSHLYLLTILKVGCYRIINGGLK